MENHLVERGVLIFFAKIFFGQLSSKKAEIFDFFETDLTFPIADCVS